MVDPFLRRDRPVTRSRGTGSECGVKVEDSVRF